MNELRAALSGCLRARVEPGDDHELDEALDQRIEAIESRLLEMGECRAEMLAALARAQAKR